MNLTQLPENLPRPVDDGAADHLHAKELPTIELMTTGGHTINLASLKGWVVLYIYPMTGRPDRDLPTNWDEIPGARGCTPQSCSFRDHHAELQLLNAQVFGLSTQDNSYQVEAKSRLHLPFELLSDNQMILSEKLQLPMFNADLAGQRLPLYKRLTLICLNAKIEKVFYPVFPPSENAQDVITWLRRHS